MRLNARRGSERDKKRARGYEAVLNGAVPVWPDRAIYAVDTRRGIAWEFVQQDGRYAVAPDGRGIQTRMIRGRVAVQRKARGGA